MFYSKEEQLKRWAVTRKKGMMRFVLIYGVLGWGLPTGILSWLALWLFEPDLYLQIGSLDTLDTMVVLFGWPLGGIGLGWGLWKWSEKQFHASLSMKNPEQQKGKST